jgi:putative colanic acid biosynthesis glycosyltransferase
LDGTPNVTVAAGNTATISAPLVSAVAITVDGDGTLQLEGDNTLAVGLLDITAGETESLGNYGGAVAVATGATFDANGGTITGSVTSTGGTVELADVSVGGNVSLVGGSVAVDGGTVTTDINNDGGAVTIATGQTLTGSIDSNNADTLNAGAGTVTNDGTVTGTVTVSDGTFTNDANGVVTGQTTASGTAAIVADGGAFDGGLVLDDASTLTLNADTDAAITNDSSVTLNLSAAHAVEGDFTKLSKYHTQMGGGMITHHQAMIYRRSVVNDLRYDETYPIAADYKFTIEYMIRCRSFLKLDMVICDYEIGGISQINAKQGRMEQVKIRREMGMKQPLTFYRQWLFQIIRQVCPSLYLKIRMVFQ